MLKIGITGQGGFVGNHLFNTLGLFPEEFSRVFFRREFFDNNQLLDSYVSQCEVIVHLAAMNRHEDIEIVYNTNIGLVKKLIASLERTGNNPHILFSSSSQEELDNLYGQSKKEGRELLAAWAQKARANFTGLIIPNIFGPFAKPMYNSVVATFSHLIANGGVPKIDIDREMKLIYVGEVISKFINKIRAKTNKNYYGMPHTAEAKVSEVLNHLMNFKEIYQDRGEIPAIKNTFELNLFNTYRSYVDLKNYFPVKFTRKTDLRGSFTEIMRLGLGGQVSFSTTVPGITRGNHYHTRKIERFAVIKGKALIKLRRIGTDEVLVFFLDGEEPAYVDMPLWYTHSIKNVGEELLYTNFWINEFYDPQDPDTFFEKV
jgi:UDP-2-acetamido-2,6-beta-L-arabino-hexul-4-ose reductase